ncbi:hypothetical protein J2S74_005313 [Evansella vedderi]|uniref:Uncharacterized protein n=1 Tax=Evansella vedderi TaxID=38282 RepID=A0ABU0A2Y5_9BACI|nr:hypothetical protein [Evansella vedderi]MDQ0257850.1 hypothetical protein [Evansella vedderi]
MSRHCYSVDLGKSPVKPHYFHRQVAWPVYAWKAILPSVLKDNLDILQKLILSFAKINKLKDATTLYELGLSKELVQTVKRSCISYGYLDTDSRLTDSGNKLLMNSMNIEQDMLMNYEHVYIFRDALTGDIIPNFNVSEIPREERKEYDFILEESKSYRNLKPTFVDIGQALKRRKQINKFAETIQKDYANEEVEAEQFSDLDEMDLSVEEVDWESVNDEGMVDVPTLAEKEAAEEKKVGEGKTTVKIISNKPDKIFLSANIYIDPDMPERIGITSPFGEHEDDWFTKHMLMHIRKSESLKDIVEFFMEEAKEELKDKFPFNNHLEIELFNKYPFIANYDEWQPLRTHIEATTRAYNRLIQGHEDYDTFYMRAQRTLEGVLKYSIEKLPNKMEVMKPVTKYSFKDTIKSIAEELRIEIPANFESSAFYERLLQVSRGKGISSKDRSLFLAFDAFYKGDESPSLLLLRNVPDFYKRINLITNIRNKSTHYNEETIENENFEFLKRELDILLDSLISHYLISRS